MDPVDVLTYFNEINEKYKERTSPFIYIDLIKDTKTLTKLIDSLDFVKQNSIQIEVIDPFYLYQKLFQWAMHEWNKKARSTDESEKRNDNINFVELKKILSDLNEEFMKHKDKLDNFFGSGKYGENTNPFFDKEKGLLTIFSKVIKPSQQGEIKYKFDKIESFNDKLQKKIKQNATNQSQPDDQSQSNDNNTIIEYFNSITNNNDSFDFNEFKKMVKNVCSYDNNTNVMELKINEHDVAILFNKYDTDGDGSIDFTEFTSMVNNESQKSFWTKKKNHIIISIALIKEFREDPRKIDDPNKLRDYLFLLTNDKTKEYILQNDFFIKNKKATTIIELKEIYVLLRLICEYRVAEEKKDVKTMLKKITSIKENKYLIDHPEDEFYVYKNIKMNLKEIARLYGLINSYNNVSPDDLSSVERLSSIQRYIIMLDLLKKRNTEQNYKLITKALDPFKITQESLDQINANNKSIEKQIINVTEQALKVVDKDFKTPYYIQYIHF